MLTRETVAVAFARPVMRPRCLHAAGEGTTSGQGARPRRRPASSTSARAVRGRRRPSGGSAARSRSAAPSPALAWLWRVADQQVNLGGALERIVDRDVAVRGEPG